jgi:hypothetical protein
MKKQKTILVTFAGRRDRMRLLTRYADAAIARGLIDEWHVWDFSRNTADARWLREQFPIVQVTPNDSSEYFKAPSLFSVRGNNRSVRFGVCATNDVHIGLRPRSASAAAYEIVLGGWSNQGSAIRRFENPAALVDMRLRDPLQAPDVYRPTPDLLPEFGSVDVEVAFGVEGIKVYCDGALLLEDARPVADGEFEAYYRTGYGSNGDWSFDSFAGHKKRLFVGRKSVLYAKETMFYTAAYQYYAANREQHENDIFVKCDDDIVFVDIDRFGDFVDFRKRNDSYFLVSANVVNNGVCAHFQQMLGAIPNDVMELELPANGMCGTLWSSGEKAERLHRLFLRDPSAFSIDAPPRVWTERISINFVAFLGRDLVHIPDVMADDEHDLCYGVRKRAKKRNCIYLPFAVSHLSFWRQDGQMDIGGVIEDYAALAEHRLRQPSAVAA